MDLGIEGRVALVTGGSRGIGRAIAAELAAEGARVAIASRSPFETAEELGVVGFAHDAADVEGAPALVGAVTERLGPVEILVTNTGGPPPGPDPLGFPRSEWEAAYRTLVLQPLALVTAVMPGMRSRGWGRVVNVASTSVREVIPFLTLSNAHRAATLAAWKTIARDVAGDGVTVNSVLPGRIGTERLFSLSGSREAAEAAAARDVPAGRLGTPEEMAAATAFLCSARASYVTGVALLVDGGLTKAV
ncbi:MAG TPA: SDR family oxidoreductase [Solirubrobacteraceae bacterium]|jgi:3-oxoacyl-[acyl-carrier protein] reductase|nr:SDR family oxidoreductase [Solirubrobacteraceae bacterium]